MKKHNILALITISLIGLAGLMYHLNSETKRDQLNVQVTPPTRNRWERNLPDTLRNDFKEAMAGKTDAQLRVGSYFYDRSSNDDDLIEAAFWFTQASTGNPVMPEAIGKLAECHYKGFGVKQDREWAKYLYISAAERGYKGAYWDAGMYSKEPDKKFSFFKSGAEAGDIGSQHALGICLIDGIGTSKNYKEAIIWLERAAYGGNVSSILALGSFHAEDPSIESQIEAYAMYNSTLSLPKSDDQLLESAVKLRAIEPRLNREQLKQAQNRTAQILGEIAKRKQSSGQAKKAR